MNKQKQNPFLCAFQGISAAYRSERNLRIHTAVALAAVTLGFGLDLAGWEWCWIMLCIALVVVVELINTAIETGIDLVSPNEHPLAKKAKDVAAGAVLVAVLFAVIVGGIIFFPRLWILLVR
ncbi:diacylglycerol kinase family protein [Parapedobacter soli]|uniref:diacylglycerol kinase family protein n=1 Tax=Parapedobacter soli TaxID=416955 RepID=UPI0021CA7139|nr:diacylglycerol kinase family protein [Parapedobacter soli]